MVTSGSSAAAADPDALRVREPRAAPRPHAAEGLLQYALAIGVVAGATALGALLSGYLPVASLALVYLLGVLVVAVRSRTRVAVFAAIFSSLAYNYFFTEPRFTLRIHSTHDVLAVASFLIVALVSGRLASRLRNQVVMLRAANEHTRTLQGAGEKLAAAADAAQVYTVGIEHLAQALGCDAVVVARDAVGAPLRQAASHPPLARLEANDLAAADWVVEHALAAGRYTDTFPGSPWWIVPLVVEGGCLGAVGLRFPAGQTLLATEQRQLAAAMIQQIALAADRTRLVHTLERARVEGETERLRAALLSSVSHDLRSPLAAVIGSATSLSAYGETMPVEDRRELLESIRSEAERLDRYIQNLLDMTRLGSGALKLERDWVGLDEILAAACARLRRLFPATEVATELEPGLPPLYVHAALLEQALFNILENAAKFSPAGAPIEVAGRRDGDRLLIEITDRGPGIPEDERRRIFDLFFSAARGDRGARGSGLGLTIVRGMIGAHGGRVEALAGPDAVGTTIRVTLPVVLPPAPSPAEEDE